MSDIMKTASSLQIRGFSAGKEESLESEQLESPASLGTLALLSCTAMQKSETTGDDDPDEMHLFESSQSGLPSQFLSLPPQFGQVKGREGREGERGREAI